MSIYKKIIVVLCGILTTPLFAPSHIYLTNKTNEILSVDSSYTGGTIAPGGFWKNPEKSIKPGEKKDIMRFSRIKKLEMGKLYTFTTTVSSLNNKTLVKLLESIIVTRPAMGSELKSDLRNAIVTPQDKDAELEWSTADTGKKSWAVNGKQYTVSFIWPDELNDEWYHDLYYEITNQ